MRFHRLLLLGLAATVLFAQTTPGRAARNLRVPGSVPAVKEFLGLSDQQVQQLVQLRRDEQAALKPIRAQIQEKAKALNEARQATSPDPATVGKLVLDMQELRKQVRTINEDYHARALALLDSAQKEKLDNLQQAARRAARSRQVVSGATALNLLLTPQPARAAAAARP